MKTNFIKTGLLIALSAIIFISCQKADINEAAPTLAPTQQKISLKQIVSNPGFAKAYHEMETKFKAQNRGSGAQFILPFFTSDGFGLGQNMVTEEWCDPLDPTFCVYQIVAGQMAFFSSELGPNDFYRTNPDKTVSVHINSKKAVAGHYDVVPDIGLNGINANMSMNYTGAVISFTYEDYWTGELVTINFIDWWSNQRGAISFHGNGKVRQGSSGLFKTLVSRWVTPAGPGQGTFGFTLN